MSNAISKKQKYSSEKTRVASVAEPEEQTTVKICLRDFNAYYGDFQAIHNVNLDIMAKRVTAFIGPSGCGKSTLLKWINRMNDIVPTAHASGSIEMGDLEITSPQTDVVSLRRRVGFTTRSKSRTWKTSLKGRFAKLPSGAKSKIDCTSPLWDSLEASNRGFVSLAQSPPAPKSC